MLKHAVIAVGLALVGCGGEAVDLAPEEEQVSFEGEWVGSLESFMFVPVEEFAPSSRNLRLTLDDTGHGRLLVGEALAPPTDPSVGYPPEAQADAGEGTGMALHLYEGVTYPLEGATVTGKTLHVELDPVQAFDAFCALQAPIETSAGEYACREPSGYGVRRPDGQKVCHYFEDGDIDQPIEEDCLVIYLCRTPHTFCQCTASTCSAGYGSSEPLRVSFELELNEARTALAGGYTFWGEDQHPQGDPQIPAQRLELWRQ